MKTLICIAVCTLVGLITGCSANTSPEPVSVDQNAVLACETTGHNLCAHCCEPQPYVDETKDGKMFTRPISACSSSPLPASWSVAWCMSDCSTEVDNSCQPGVQ